MGILCQEGQVIVEHRLNGVPGTQPGRGGGFSTCSREGTPPHNPRPGASRLWEAVSLPEPLPAGNRRPETPPAARAPGAVGDAHRSNHRLARPAPDASLERRSVSTPEPVPACFLCGDWRPDGEAIEPEAARSIERSGTRSDRSRREQLPTPHAQRWADRTFLETVSVLMVSDSWPA